MGEAVNKLIDYMPKATGFNIPYSDLRAAHIAALNERLQERVGKIKLVGLRAKDAGISEIRALEDIVPLLLPHTAYKSYPERFLTEKRWDKLTKWLETVSSYPINVDLSGVTDIDSWVTRLAENQHYLSCSSGTTGNPAMLMSSRADVDFACKDIVAALMWGSDIKPNADRKLASVGMVTSTPRGTAMGGSLFANFMDASKPPFSLPVPPITIGSVTKMIALRKAIGDGTAKPGEIAEFEAESAVRQKAVDEAFGKAADALIAARGDKMYFTGYWGQLYQVAEEVRKRGYSGKDFHPENCAYLAGGLKKAQLPANYREVVFETFNISPRFAYHMYSMQELQTSMPRCQEGNRYHIPPWLICLPLDKDGDNLLPGVGDEVEGRAAFFDLSLDGRWGGVISGDHVHVDYKPCKCGNASPSLRDDIHRYADLKGDDKIACSGTIDAYVRGMT
jgi:hypothetical protein